MKAENENKQQSSLSPSRQISSIKPRSYSGADVEFMNSLSNAVLSSSSSKMNGVLYVICLIVVALIAWSYFAELDERTRGIGRVIPSRQIQVVQNLEGGIIKEINVFEGQVVKQGEILVTIDDTSAGSTFAEGRSKINELKARSSRLRAEAGLTEGMEEVEGEGFIEELMQNEKRLYLTNLEQHGSRKAVLEQQLKQRKIELEEVSQDIKAYRESLKMISREIELSKPLLAKQLLSELEFLQTEQKSLEKNQELNRAMKREERLKLQIIEVGKQIEELEETRQSEAMQELNAASAEIARLSHMQRAVEDRVTRTSVRSPVDGVIKQLLINTVGGVVRPGMDILEIVPNDESLLLETKIKPSDIAFIFPGQKALLKFTAYDFSIYGGLDGEVTHISADTITDERKEEFYLVRIKSDRNYLGEEENTKQIIVGMTAQVDIITGKKTVMQ